MLQPFSASGSISYIFLYSQARSGGKWPVAVIALVAMPKQLASYIELLMQDTSAEHPLSPENCSAFLKPMQASFDTSRNPAAHAARLGLAAAIYGRRQCATTPIPVFQVARPYRPAAADSFCSLICSWTAACSRLRRAPRPSCGTPQPPWLVAPPRRSS